MVQLLHLNSPALYLMKYNECLVSLSPLPSLDLG